MPEATEFGFTESDVTTLFDSLGIDYVGPLRLARIGIGQSNLTFLVSDERAGRWVLRRPPLGRLLASAHDVAREARILSALEGTNVPTPRVYGVGNTGETPLVLMDFVDGLVLDQRPVAEGLSLRHRHAIGLSLARTLAKVHAVDLDETGLSDLASHKPYAQRQLTRWSTQWQQSKTRELPLLHELTDRLRANVPEQHELTLVHGDFHLRNVITSLDSGEVAAVLDWELSTLGDPMADLGCLLAYWPESGEPTAGDFAVCTLAGFPTRDELVKAYHEETGRDLSALGFWHALGLWKIAVIGEGVLRRALDEPRNKAAFGTPTVAQIEALVVHAVEVAESAGL